MSKNLINYRDSSNNTAISVGIRFEASYAERKESYAKTSVMYANHYAYMLFTCWALYNTRSLSHFTSYTYPSKLGYIRKLFPSWELTHSHQHLLKGTHTYSYLRHFPYQRHYYRWWMCLVLPATRIPWHVDVESSRTP